MRNKFQSLILASNQAKPHKVYKLYDKLYAENKEPLILITSKNLNIDKKYSTKTVKTYQEIFKIKYNDIRTLTYDFFYSLANKEVYSGLDLKQLTTYNGVSLWELSAVPIFSQLTSLLYDIELADAILNHEQPLEVHIINDTNQLGKIFMLICDKKQILCFNHAKTFTWVLSVKKTIWKTLILIKSIKKTLLSLYFMFKNFIKSKKLMKAYKIIFFAPYGRFFASMLPVVLQYNDDERLVINAFQLDCSKKMKENKIFFTDPYGYKLYVGLFDRKISKFLKGIKGAIYNSSFFSRITYKTLSTGTLLYDMFEGLIYEHFPEKIREIDSVKKILFSYGPKIVVVADVSFDIALIAKSLTKTVVCIQTGHANEFIFFGPAIADAITVEGSYWKKYLSGKGVDEKKISIVGIAKLDILNSDVLFKKKSNLYFGIDKSKKNIVFADVYGVSTFGTLESERIEHINVLFNAIKNIKDVNLIIKLHPCANNTDLTFFKKKAQKINLLNYKIVKEVNMLALIKNCDLLITHSSGASYEAVLMQKNVILTTYSSNFNSEDTWDFERYGVALTVHNLEDLEKYIRMALFDPVTASNLSLRRNEYIVDHAYKIDGKAGERAKEAINRFL